MWKVKIVFLSSLLALVVYALNSGKINFSFLNDPTKINWCATRVIEIGEENSIISYRVFQEGTKWIKESDQRITLTPPAMEKWLGEHCTIKLDQQMAAPTNELEKLGTIRVKLLSGQTFEFERYSGGFHRLGENHWFKSNEWDLALAQLATLGL